MVSSLPPTSTDSSTLTSLGGAPSCRAAPLSPTSSSLYGSAASSSRASPSLTARRENRWPCLTIARMRASMAFRSAGPNGCGTSKS